MEQWRLLDLGYAEPLLAQTFYEAVAEAVHRGLSHNTLILIQPASPYACLGYHQDLEKEIDGELTEADKKAKPVEPHMPPDRTKTYDRYIALYKATQAEKVYLSEQHFGEFFLDEWEFIRTHISHLRMMRAGGTGTWLNEDLSSVAANALTMYAQP